MVQRAILTQPVAHPSPRPSPRPSGPLLMLPFGALTGFVSVGLTFMAAKHGLSITDGALLNGANVLSPSGSSGCGRRWWT